MPQSKGDPRVLFAMNLVLSAVFASVVVWGLSVPEVLPFTWGRVAVATGVLVVVTHLVTR